MNRTLIKKYIDNQTTKVVSLLDLMKSKITYDGIIQCRTINEISGDEEMS